MRDSVQLGLFSLAVSVVIDASTGTRDATTSADRVVAVGTDPGEDRVLHVWDLVIA